MNTRSTCDIAFEPRELRDVLGRFTTGVAVVTTCGDRGLPLGLAVNSFAPVSLDPPEILWSIMSTAPSRSAFERHGTFAVNIMGEEAKDQTLRFARPSDDKFDGVAWRRGRLDVPILDGALAVLECDVKDMIVSGDHHIVIGSVREIDSRDGDPLVFFRGRFSALGASL